MNRHKIRVSIELAQSLIFSILYLPHIISYFFHKQVINEDLERWKNKVYLTMPTIVLLIYKLHTDPYFRSIFYFRIGPIMKILIGWYRPGSPTFSLPPSLILGGGIYAPHAYSTFLNAKSIGKNFSCIQCTTIGKEKNGRPTIGDNVDLGCNVVIIGNVNIGSNVLIGAGSVVVTDIPDNSVAVGVPAKVIKQNGVRISNLQS